MKDKFGREIRSIRISVTKRCNLHCFYCHKEGQQKVGSREMTPDEIGRIGRIASKIGITKAKITGGEPLLRKDLEKIVSSLKKSMHEVSLTTNGIFLAERAAGLEKAGLDRVNININTLVAPKYMKITGYDGLKRSLEGIHTAVKVGLNPVKMNMVVMKGINDDEIKEMIKQAGNLGAILQLIELETEKKTISKDYYRKYHTDLQKIETELAGKANRIEKRELHHRIKYFIPNEVEVVRPMQNMEFCANCNRIRLTSDGRLKPCLFDNKNLVDILTPMRTGSDDEAIKFLFLQAIELRRPYWQ